MLGYIFGQITTKIFDNHISNNYNIEAISRNFNDINSMKAKIGEITATRTKIRYISIIPIFVITVIILNILFG